MGLLDWLLDSMLSDNNNVDPFAAAGIAYGLKGDKLTDKDITQLGTVLGASGAFDDKKDDGGDK